MKLTIIFLGWTFCVFAMDPSYKYFDKAVYNAAQKNRPGLMSLAHICGGRYDAINPRTGKAPLDVAGPQTRVKLLQELLQVSQKPFEKAFVDFDYDFKQEDTTPLGYASYQGNLPLVQQLLREGGNPNGVGKNGIPPLIIAIQKRRFRISNTLLEAGADPNAVTTNGITPLILAASSGQFDICYLLLEYKANPLAVRNDGATALIAATIAGYPISSKLLSHKMPVHAYDNNGFAAIHYAAQLGHLVILQDLLNIPVSVNFITLDGRTSLTLATESSRANIVFELLNSGADPDFAKENQPTPLQIAFKNTVKYHHMPFDPQNEHLKLNSRLIIKYLLMFGAHSLQKVPPAERVYLSTVLPTGFILASAIGDVDLLNEKYPFLLKKIPTGPTNDLQYILDEALIIAIGQCQKQVVQFLLEHGANPMTKLERISGLPLAQHLSIRFKGTPREHDYAELLTFLEAKISTSVPRRLSVFQ